MINPSYKLPVNRAILWILLSTLLVSGTALMATLYYWHAKETRLNDNQYRIVALVQNCPQSETLKTSYLAQLLHLSLDQPMNLYQFSIKEGESRLLECPLIKSANIQKIRPGALYIEYQIHTPIAFLGDYTNTAIDAEGVLFPYQPFFTPKRLPLLYLGLEGEWGKSYAADERLKLALNVLKKLEEVDRHYLSIKQIDVTDALSDSYGKRQIVVLLKSMLSDKSYLLRLSHDDFAANIDHFELLLPQLSTEAPQTIIDLRISQLAFLKK